MEKSERVHASGSVGSTGFVNARVSMAKCGSARLNFSLQRFIPMNGGNPAVVFELTHAIGWYGKIPIRRRMGGGRATGATHSIIIYP